MNKAILLSIQVGTPQRYESDEESGQGPWTTAFFKTPVDGPVRVGRTNVEGDRQADARYHGGFDKAVLTYAADHYPLWHEDLNRDDLTFGGFAENFTIQGLDEDTVCIGDSYRIGEVVVQVSQPRQPCWKISRRWGIADLTHLVLKTGRTGWYLRVLQEGRVEAGLPVVLQERPYPQWTVRRALQVYNQRGEDPLSAADLGECKLLSKEWLEKLRGIK